MQYETCRHIHESGAYCGSPALKDRKYCHHHLTHRGRRLRRARALRDNLPYRLELPPLLDLDSVQFALSEITLALGDGQLDQRVAGKMLYAIQQAASLLKFRAKLAAAQSETTNAATDQTQVEQRSYVQEYPNFEKDFGLEPGADIDAETERTLLKADEAIELRQANDMPAPPPGIRMGSAQYRVYREECYTSLRLQLNHMKHELRDYYAEKNKKVNAEIEEMRKAAAAAGFPSPQQTTKTA